MAELLTYPLILVAWALVRLAWALSGGKLRIPERMK
jgi:hypothetical protein